MITTIELNGEQKRYIELKTLKTIFTNKQIEENFIVQNGTYIWGDYNIYLYSVELVIDKICNGAKYRFLHTDKKIEEEITREIYERAIKKTDKNKKVRI